MTLLKNYIYLFILCLFVSNLSLAQEKDSLIPTKYYYENGQVSSEGNLRNGQPDGYWKSYHRSGVLKTEGNRENQQLDGIWKFYTEEGDLYLTIEYKDNKKNGTRTTYKGVSPYKKEQFKDDVKDGFTEVFYANGSVKKQTPFVNGREKGLAYEYDTAGIITTLLTYKAGVLVKEQQINRYKDGLKKGLWMEFHTNRAIKNEGLYVNDLRHGYWKYYKSDGNLIKIEKWIHGVLVENANELAKIDVRREINPETGRIKTIGGYRNGKKEGVHREYDENGEVIGSTIYKDGLVLAEGIYDEQGRKQGLWKYYYVTGELKEQGKYRNDKKTGTWKYFYLDGTVEQIGDYAYDLPDGIWRWYTEENNLRLEENYIDGFEDGPSTEYSDSGEVVAQGNFIEGFKDGEWIYTINNTIEKGKYYEGEKQGNWKRTYIDTKKTAFEGEYLNGIENGFHTYYYPNGQVQRRGRYRLGIRDGIWEYFDETGKIELTIRYEDGEEIEYNGVKISYGKRVDRQLEKEKQERDIQQ